MILALAAITPVWGQTPAFVQTMHTASSDGNETSQFYWLSLPDPVPTGDCVIIGMTYNFSAGRTVAITDLVAPGGPSAANLGSQNTWTQGVTVNEGNTISSVYYTQNGSVAGTQSIKIAFDAALGNFQAVVSYFYNTSCVTDGSHGAANITGPTIAAGSFSTTVNGDLIYNYGMDSVGGFPGTGPAVTAYTPGTNFTWLSANRAPATIVSWAQYWVQPTLGAINASITATGDTDTDNLSVALAFKAASQGSDLPPGIHIRHLFTLDDGAASPQTINFPSSGNLIEVSHSGSTTQDNVTGVTSSPSNTFTKHSDDPNGSAQLFSTDSGATTSNTLTLTITWAGTPNGASSIIYDVSGAAASPFDKIVGNNTTTASAATTSQARISTDTTVTVGANSIANGDFLMWSGVANFEIVQVTAGGGTGTLTISRGQWTSVAGSHASGTLLYKTTLASVPSITPATANGLVICNAGLTTGPTSSTAPGTFDHMHYLTESDTGANNSADYYSHYYNPNTSAINNTMILNNGANSTGVNYICAAYKAASISSGICTLASVGAGTC